MIGRAKPYLTQGYHHNCLATLTSNAERSDTSHSLTKAEYSRTRRSKYCWQCAISISPESPPFSCSLNHRNGTQWLRATSRSHGARGTTRKTWLKSGTREALFCPRGFCPFPNVLCCPVQYWYLAPRAPHLLSTTSDLPQNKLSPLTHYL